MTLEDALDTIVVDWDFRDSVSHIYPFGVSDENDIIARFKREDDALRFRLSEINRRLNP